MLKRWVLAALAVLAAGVCGASPIVMDFDGLNDGDAVTTQYPGIVFTNTVVLTASISLNEFEFPPFSGVNVASDSGGPIEISFASPTQSFSGSFTYLVPLAVRAFDSSDNEVALATSLFSSNLALSGDTGSGPNELISVAFAGGISRVSITGDNSGGSFTLDNATASAIPEPRTMFLMLAGVVLVVARCRNGGRPPRAGGRQLPGLFVAIVLLFASHGVVAAQQIVAAAAFPQAIAVNSTSTVTISVFIADPNVLPSGVNLLRVDGTGRVLTLLGGMTDDGTHGDRVAGDRVFTGLVSLTESRTGPVYFQVSAAFRGILRRVLSNIVNVDVVDTPVPPDPGDAGKQTLVGVDTDRDGVRDDVQRFIALSYAESPTTKLALRQVASVYQEVLLNADSPVPAQNSMRNLFASLDCLRYVRPEDWDKTALELRTVFLNTDLRSDQWFRANRQFDGRSYVLTADDKLKTRCTFNPD